MLSDNKLEKLQAIHGGQDDLWYITKQNCNFRDLCYIANILEIWNNDPSTSYQVFFDQKKRTLPFSQYLPENTAHRATVNCSYFGLLRQTIGRTAYNPEDLTPVYYYIKRLCNGDFSNTQSYQHIIDNQLEKITINNNNFAIHPIMFSLKILLLIGDATGTYSISLEEFKLFVATAQRYNEYFEVVESILRFRTDMDFKQQCLANKQKVGDTRYNLVVKNHSFFDEESDTISLIEDRILQTRRRVAEFELKQAIDVNVNDEEFYNITADTLSSNKEKNLFTPAIRTKPFLLLAGISGTGKSRIVREFAFKSCPKFLQDKDGTTPGNYCMIEVKPNWHDSTELLGYYSNLSGSYQFKKFVKFLVKAMMFPDVPFFVCLDEMNLAPVEQYFAEILSILETRKHPKMASGEVDMSTIKTDAIIEGKYFKELTWKDAEGAIHSKVDMTDKDWYETFFDVDSMTDGEKEQVNKYQYSRILQNNGLSLPDNVIIIGTVNMDDTTHQFSRKVIYRAMTIEMNGGRLADMYGGSKNLEYIENEEEQKKWQHSFSQRYVTADEVLDTHPDHAEDIKRILPERLDSLNKALRGTPFEVSYRVLNELTIMVGVMLDDNEKNESLEEIINQSINNILLMKILPRIEGDAEMFALSKEYKIKMGVDYDDRLKWLETLAPDIHQAEKTQDNPEEEDGSGVEDGSEIETKPQDSDAHHQTAKEKIREMIDRLNNQDFTRFWP